MGVSETAHKLQQRKGIGKGKYSIYLKEWPYSSHKLSGRQTRTNVTERYLKFIRRQKVKGLMGAASSLFAAQQISIQYRKVTWENISCVSKRQGEKWQLAVYNSSTLLSYWFCPRLLRGLWALRSFWWHSSAPFWDGGWEDTDTKQVTRMCGGSLLRTAPQTHVCSDNHSLCWPPLSSGCYRSPGIGQVQREGDKDS